MGFLGFIQYFYPRHPRGWRPVTDFFHPVTVIFLSTPPSRVATRHASIRTRTHQISIHATLAGGDLHEYRSLKYNVPFLSTPPSRVATWASTWTTGGYWRFLSTPPSRVATQDAAALTDAQHISIHATLAGGDQSNSGRLVAFSNFYPRHPRGWRRRTAGQSYAAVSYFYPRHPRGWRPPVLFSTCFGLNFYPRHPRGWRRVWIKSTLWF